MGGVTCFIPSSLATSPMMLHIFISKTDKGRAIRIVLLDPVLKKMLHIFNYCLFQTILYFLSEEKCCVWPLSFSRFIPITHLLLSYSNNMDLLFIVPIHKALWVSDPPSHLLTAWTASFHQIRHLTHEMHNMKSRLALISQRTSWSL